MHRALGLRAFSRRGRLVGSPRPGYDGFRNRPARRHRNRPAGVTKRSETQTTAGG